MEILEKDLETLICNAAKTVDGQRFLRSRNLLLRGRVFRQVQLGNYGIADIITAERVTYPADPNIKPQRQRKAIVLTIYELKKGPIGLSALGQVMRYKTAVERLAAPQIRARGYNVVIETALIGDSLEMSSDFVYLLNETLGLSVYTYSLAYDGLHFEQHDTQGWKLSNEGDLGLIVLSPTTQHELITLSKLAPDEWI